MKDDFKVYKISRADLEDGDILFAELPFDAPASSMKPIKQHLKQLLTKMGVNVEIIVSNGVKLHVIKTMSGNGLTRARKIVRKVKNNV